jgi:hypothetical protein
MGQPGKQLKIGHCGCGELTYMAESHIDYGHYLPKAGQQREQL